MYLAAAVPQQRRNVAIKRRQVFWRIFERSHI